MKTINIKNLLSVLLIVLFGAFVSACGESEPLYIAVTNVSLNKTEVELIEGESVQLTATVQPAEATNKNVTWQSNNTAVATVDDKGNITAVKAGTAEITATANEGKTALCKITVKAKTISVIGISLNKEELQLTINESATLTATVLPENATDKTVSWHSSNTTVASVDTQGKVIALGAGKADITVTTNDGNKTAICKLDVKPKLPLAYVAEYNLSGDGKTFATSHKNDVSGYFTWSDVVAKADALDGWHCPTINEWRGVFADYGYIRLDDIVDQTNVSEEIQFGAKTEKYTADYKSTGNGVSYAIKMKGNGDVYRTAYHYQMEGSKTDGNYRLVVKCKYLGVAGKTISMSEVANESFWDTYDIKRSFSGCGFMHDGSLYMPGEIGHYWSSTALNGYYYYLFFSNKKISCSESDYMWTIGRSIRLFSDK